MHSKDITSLLGIQELIVNSIEYPAEKEVYIYAESKDKIQQCPYCKGFHITRNGIPYYREVRRLIKLLIWFSQQ